MKHFRLYNYLMKICFYELNTYVRLCNGYPVIPVLVEETDMRKDLWEEARVHRREYIKRSTQTPLEGSRQTLGGDSILAGSDVSGRQTEVQSRWTERRWWGQNQLLTVPLPKSLAKNVSIHSIWLVPVILIHYNCLFQQHINSWASGCNGQRATKYTRKDPSFSASDWGEKKCLKLHRCFCLILGTHVLIN